MDPRQDVVIFEIDARDEQHECLEIHTKYDVSQPIHEIKEVCKCFVILSERLRRSIEVSISMSLREP